MITREGEREKIISAVWNEIVLIMYLFMILDILIG